MMIPEEKVSEILERTDIAELVARRVELKRAGRSLKGLCPFHGEHTPSFHVNTERRRFKCFGCGAGGDAISFVMKAEGKGFLEAAKELAALSGVRLDDAGEDKLQKEKLEQRRVHQLAARFYAERLWEPREGLQARQYLKKRGLTAETVKSFTLGYAPAAWADFSVRAAKEGMLELALGAGLVSERREAPPSPNVNPNPSPNSGAQDAAGRRPNSRGTYDFFRGRLMIPIRNADGITVAFGGRILQGNDPRKFMNSRESHIYKKAELLFGIDQAAQTIRKSGQALLVEGYFDAILLHQAGLTNAVALCSASLTQDQVKLLRRFDAKELVLILDGDDAGRRGVTRAAGALLATAMPTRVMVLPTGIDPDDHVRKIGGEAFKREVEAAVPLTEHLIQSALPKSDAAPSFEARLRGLEELKPILAQLPDGLERALFLKTLSERLGIPEATLAKALHPKVENPRAAPSLAAQPSNGSPATQATRPPQTSGLPAGTQSPRRAVPVANPAEKLIPEEALLFAHLLHDPELARLPQSEELQQLAHPGLRSAAVALVDSVIDGAPQGRQALLGLLSLGIRQSVEQLLIRVEKQPAQAHREEYLQRCVLHRSHLARSEVDELQRHLRELAQQITALRKSTPQSPELQGLIDEHLRLTQEKQDFTRARRTADGAAIH